MENGMEFNLALNKQAQEVILSRVTLQSYHKWVRFYAHHILCFLQIFPLSAK